MNIPKKLLSKHLVENEIIYRKFLGFRKYLNCLPAEDLGQWVKKHDTEGLSLQDFICPICKNSKVKKFIRQYCSRDCEKKSRVGVKRPEHSAKMKIIMKAKVEEGTFWGKEHRKNNLLHMQKMNKNLDRSKQSDILKSTDSARRTLQRLLLGRGKFAKYTNHKLFKNSELSCLNSKKINSYSDKKIRKYVKIFKSLKSHIAMENNPNMGLTIFYKRQKLTKIKKYYKQQKKSVVFRSSWEYKFAVWCENNPDVSWWKFEPFTYSISNFFHIPDFRICYKKENWTIEIKGFFRPDVNKNLLEKTLSTVAFFREKNVRYCLFGKPCFSKVGFSTDNFLDLTDLSDREIKKHMILQVPGLKNAKN